MTDNYFANVDWQTVEPQSGGGRQTFDQDGWHKVVIDDSKGAPNSKNTGMLWTAYIKCVEGPDSGKIIESNHNVFHQSAQAQEIGQREFSGYCHAIGEYKPIDNNASNLRNKPFMARTETVEETYVKDGQEKTAKKTLVRECARVGDPRTMNGATSGNASSVTAPATAPASAAVRSSETVQAGWSSPPPSAGNAAPAQTWGTPAATGDSGKPQAPWGSKPAE